MWDLIVSVPDHCLSFYYAKLTQVRESTRLSHTHIFTSLKNVVISALHKIDKRIHIQIKIRNEIL